MKLNNSKNIKAHNIRESKIVEITDNKEKNRTLCLVVYDSESSMRVAKIIGKRVSRDGGKVIYVRNKIDNGITFPGINGEVRVSAKTGDGISYLWERIMKEIEDNYPLALDVLVEELSGKYHNNEETNKIDGAVSTLETVRKFLEIGNIHFKNISKYLIKVGKIEREEIKKIAGESSVESDEREGKEIVILHSRNFVAKVLMKIEEICDDIYDGKIDLRHIIYALNITPLSAIAYLKTLEKMGYLIKTKNGWVSVRWLIDKFSVEKGKGHKLLSERGYKLKGIKLVSGEWEFGNIINSSCNGNGDVVRGVYLCGDRAYVGYYFGDTILVEAFLKNKEKFHEEGWIKAEKGIHYCPRCGKAFWLGGLELLIERLNKDIIASVICNSCLWKGGYRAQENPEDGKKLIQHLNPLLKLGNYLNF